ncbi:MAG: hypothetical protein Q9217_000675 [Psora testacea]
MTAVPDHVRVSKLDTQFCSDPEHIQHVRYVCGSTAKQRGVRKEEKWKRESVLGRGGSGIVWLERCIQGDCNGEVRAVKKVQKLESGDYYKELEAIVLFSHTKYERCFVKSFGWYDNDDSVFITMEYLPNGDLHKYLSLPLPEKEGQHIVFQILEGLQFMHDHGFAHRDLKPANVLVVCEGPDWWVKIADFGISKRASEGLTKLRTRTGTPAFAAPEVLGYFRPGDTSDDDSYTNAVDIWSLSVITFLILTGKTLFENPRRLDYLDPEPFASWSTQDQIDPEPFASWSTQDQIDPEPSNSWSTQDQITAHETQRSIGMLTKRTTPTSNEAIALPISEPATQINWYIRRTFKGHSSYINAVVFLPDGKQIASGSCDKTVKLWDWANGTTCGTLQGHPGSVTALAVSPDGKKIASGSDDKTVRLWDSVTGAVYGIFEGHSNMVYALVFSPDGKQIASGSSDNTVKLWDSATGATYGTFKGHSNTVQALAFSLDGKQIGSGSYDKTIRLWDLVTGATYSTFKGHSDRVTAIAFSPDGKQIASGSVDKTVRLWDSVTGAVYGIFKGHSEWVCALIFSPDGKQIASGSYDKTVKLWDSATGTIYGTLKGHSDGVIAVAFSPDGKQIASGSYDKTVKVWDLTIWTAPAEEKTVSK